MARDEVTITRRDKLVALYRVATWRPAVTAGLVVFGAIVAVLEGIGLTFIFPIIEVAQGNPLEGRDAIIDLFLAAFAVVGLSVTIGSLVTGIAIVMTVRYSAAFIRDWWQAILQTRFERHLRDRTFAAALEARVSYHDDAGSDDILNATITETRYAAEVIRHGIQAMQVGFLAAMYLAVMLYVAPGMTLLAFALLGTITLVLRRGIQPAFTVGSAVALANRDVQRTVQAGTQGIRDVKSFALTDDVLARFRRALDRYTASTVRLERNEAAIENAYDLAAALTLFVLIYVGFVHTGLSLGVLGIFLFALFQLAPLASRLNAQVYRLEGRLSHLVRTQAFLEEVAAHRESARGRPIERVDHITFEDVSFGYDPTDPVLRDVSFSVDRGDFVAFVGPSGAGKSTIVALLERLIEPNDGTITADGDPIETFDIVSWRKRIAVVRQRPFIFNDTLWNNVTVGAPNTSRQAVERACRLARVDAFLDDLPEGYDTHLGDDGVRLSGGQRQRVAIARALVAEADFLVLDEATSELDATTERQVHEAINAADREYGVLAIAHRLSTVENADRIYSLEKGRITETGTHHDLIAKGGTYASLYGDNTSRS